MMLGSAKTLFHIASQCCEGNNGRMVASSRLIAVEIEPLDPQSCACGMITLARGIAETKDLVHVKMWPNISPSVRPESCISNRRVLWPVNCVIDGMVS